MAEPEVVAAWRAEFKRSGARELRDAVNNGDGFTDESKRLASFRWLGDEAEARRLQDFLPARGPGKFFSRSC